MKTALPLILVLSTMSSCRGNMDEFDEFDEFGDVQENIVRREIKSDDYVDPDPEILPRKRHDILIQFCSS